MNTKQASGLAEPMLSRRTRISLNLYSILGLIVVVDQLLLPMLHIGSMPFKISYFICGFWLLHWLQRSHHARDVGRDVASVFIPFALIVCCIVMGELMLAVVYPVNAYYELVRGIVTYVIVALAFGLGRSTKKFQLKWLIWVFFAAVALNFIFIVFKTIVIQLTIK